MVGNYFNWSFDSTLAQPILGVLGEKQKNVEKGIDNMNGLLQDFENYLVVTFRKKHTVITYLNSVKRYLEFSKGIVDQNTINGYLKHLYSSYKPNTISMYILGLDKYLDYIGKSYFHVPIPQGVDTVRNTITLNQIQEIKSFLRNQDLSNVLRMQEYLVFQFITDLDTRNHEITKSRWKHIHDNKILFEDCKTGNTFGFLSDETLLALDRYKPLMRYKHKDYIFVNQAGRYKGIKWSDNCWKVHRIVTKISKQVIGQTLCPQDFRASIITEEYNNWVNPKVIQRKARHRSQKTTLKYNHVGERELRDYIDTGTIFGNDNSILFKQKTPNGNCKRSYIKTLSQDLSETGDNNIFSFSVSPFFGLLGVGI